MKIKFKDHFSGHSADYRNFRPVYPVALYEFLNTVVRDNKLVWDCATGSGQCARNLVEYFDKVLATDASESQIRNAPAHPGISYRTAAAENVDLCDETVDLITVAQAMHWFDIPAFFKEAERVLKPGGVLAVWNYHLLKIEPAIDEIVDEFYTNRLDAYWPAERRILENNFSDFVFPFEKVDVPDFSMSSSWSLAGLSGYLSTWSAVKQCLAAEGQDPLQEILPRLEAAWGADPSNCKSVRWPLALHVRRKPEF